MTDLKRFSEYLVETTLSRVWQKATDPLIPMGIITAFRDDQTAAENHAANDHLAAAIKSAGYGYSWVDGVYTYTDGRVPAKFYERSIIVTGRSGDTGQLRADLKRWLVMFGQQSVLFRNAGAPIAVFLYTDHEVPAGPFHANLPGIQPYMTKLRHRPGSFVFTEAWQGMNGLERAAAQASEQEKREKV